MSVSSVLWPPGDEATEPIADPTGPARDDPAPEVMLLTPAEIDSYRAPCTVGASPSAGSMDSASESSTACDARCTEKPRDGASGSGCCSRPLIEAGSLPSCGGASGWGVSSIALMRGSSLVPCGGRSGEGVSSTSPL